MQVLFDAIRPVKPASRNFGRGIAPTRLARFVPSQADLDRAEQHLNANATDYEVVGPSNAVIEEAYQEFEMRSRMDRGYIGC